MGNHRQDVADRRQAEQNRLGRRLEIKKVRLNIPDRSPKKEECEEPHLAYRFGLKPAR